MASAPELFVLDVGHGSCNVIVGDDSVAIVDTGRSRTLIQFLEERGVERVDLILISHADADHLGGLVGVLSSGIDVGRVVLNADALKDSDMWEDITALLDHMNEHAHLDFGVGLHRGQAYILGNFELQIDAPRPGFAARGVGSRLGEATTTSNSMSAVVSVMVGQRRWAVLTGDIDSLGLADLLEVADPQGGLQTELLLYPHHGGLSGGDDAVFAEALLDLTQPSTVAFSIGRVHSTPRPEHVREVLDRGCRIACTQLSTRCAANLPADAAAHHLLDVVGRGRLAGTCCAGSLSLMLTPGGELSPDENQHQDFIGRSVPTPLCR